MSMRFSEDVGHPLPRLDEYDGEYQRRQAVTRLARQEQIERLLEDVIVELDRHEAGHSVRLSLTTLADQLRRVGRMVREGMER